MAHRGVRGEWRNPDAHRSCITQCAIVSCLRPFLAVDRDHQAATVRGGADEAAQANWPTPPTRLGKEDSWHQCPAQDCPVKERLQDNRCKGCWTEFLHDVKIVIAIIITIFISFLIVIFICTTVVHFTSPRRLGATL